MWGSYSYLFGPVVALCALGILILLLRWAFSRGHSLVERPSRRGQEDAYGLLVPVAAPPTFIEGEILRRTLEDAGIKANIANTLDGPRIMVFPKDEQAARAVLDHGK